MITILSIPRTGTRFWYHFVTRVLHQEARYAHFSAKTVDAICDYLNKTNDVIIVPMRDHEETLKSAHSENSYLIEDATASRAVFMEWLTSYGAHFMDTVKNEHTHTQISNLIDDLGLTESTSVKNFIKAWEPIGSQHSNDPTSDEILREMLNCKALCKTT